MEGQHPNRQVHWEAVYAPVALATSRHFLGKQGSQLQSWLPWDGIPPQTKRQCDFSSGEIDQ